MKKICMLFVSIMILPVVLSATPMNVVGEVFTSTSCGYCPSAREGIRDLADEFDNFIPLIWQSPNGYVGMASPYYSMLANMYGVSGIPHARFGGYISEIGGLSSGSMYNYYLPHYNTINGLESPLAIDIVMDQTSDSTLDIQADIEVTGDISTTNNKLILLMTNKYSDDYTCAVVAYYFEDFGLTTIGETGTYSTSFTYKSSWDLFEIKAVAVVQTFSNNYQILQAATCEVNIIVPAFSSNVQSGPPQLDVQFYNESSPGGGTCEWDLNGDGTWDSTEENPYYCYDAIGTYNVSLRVSNGDEIATITVEDYITVTGTSDISGALSGKWTEAYSPYTITGDANIPDGNMLEIGPNVEIRTDNGSKITIEGNLSAIGSDEGNIIFTTDDSWKGLYFSNSDYENVLSYAQITGSEYSAVDISGSSVYIGYSTIYGNMAITQKGPAINVSNSDDVCVEWNIISNNSSSNIAGAISLVNSSPTIERNIIVNNQALYAGAFSMTDDSCPELINNTVANNLAPYTFYIYSSSNPTIENCIIRQTGDVFINYSSTPTVIYSDLTGGYTGTGNIDSDPQFVNPTAGDGPDYNGLEADWSLQETSPCIDTGNPDSPYDPDGTRADMGALYYDHVSVDDPGLSEMTLRCYPNPFRNETTISFYSKASDKPDCVTIYNIKGERVRTLELEQSVNGYSTIWDGTDTSGKRVSSGIYFYKLDTENQIVIKKMMVVK